MQFYWKVSARGAARHLSERCQKGERGDIATIEVPATTRKP